ncbi:776_t:CDS:10 [Ambispora gerdemannii]|uniref:776_t:CDS:1 n=1 Tax=Ambispora gerdemannii TaxID=144530 RepID=A0A9N8ZFG4_9GLOM|nr:776_t:CDS:10 [Ambispora gerdemannii]
MYSTDISDCTKNFDRNNNGQQQFKEILPNQAKEVEYKNAEKGLQQKTVDVASTQKPKILPNLVSAPEVNGQSNGKLHSSGGSGVPNVSLPTSEELESQNVVGHFELVGLRVLMVHKNGQIIYKLPGNMSVQSLPVETRELLMEKIKEIHRTYLETPTLTTANKESTVNASNLTAPTENTQQSRSQSSLNVPAISQIGHNRMIVSQSLQTQQPYQSLRHNNGSSLTTPTTNHIGHNRMIAPQQNSTTTQQSSSSKLTTGNSLTTATINQIGHTRMIAPQTLNLLQTPNKLENTNLETNKYSTQSYLSSPTPSLPAVQSPTKPAFASSYSTTGTSYSPTGTSYAATGASYSATGTSYSPTGTSYSATGTSYAATGTSYSATGTSYSATGTSSTTATTTNHETSTKPTRKYNKTGRYSKKRPRQQEADADLQQQQQQALSIEQRTIAQPVVHMTDSAQSQVQYSFAQSLAEDHRAVLYPDYKTPFSSFGDVLNRLLPYHIYQYADNELDSNKNTSTEEEGTRRKVIYDKFHDILRKEAKKPAPDHLTHFCEKVIVDDMKEEVTQLRQQKQQLEAALRHQQLKNMASSSLRRPSDLNKSRKQKKRECSYCGLTARIPDGVGGFMCPRGHRDERLQVQVGEDTDFLVHGSERRKKRTKEPDKNEKAKLTVPYFGDKKIYVYSVSLQHVLRHQVRIMIENMNCPPEYERVIRHLWTLFINASNIKFPQDWVDEHGKIRNNYKKDDIAVDDDEDEDLERLLTLQKPLDESEGGDGALDNVEDLVKENGDSDEDDKDKKEGKRRRKPRKIFPEMNVNLSILYLGCVWLRQPILLADIIKWANSDRIPYFSARTLLPKSLRVRLDRYNRSFEPIIMRNMHHFENIVTKLVTVYNSHYGISFPEINMPPILYRFVREFLLPVEFYPIAKELGNLVGLDLSVSGYMVRHYSNPGPKLMGLLVIVTKLIYGLDGQERIPSEKDQFAKFFPSKEKWFAALRKRCAHKFKVNLPTNLRNLSGRIHRVRKEATFLSY